MYSLSTFRIHSFFIDEKGIYPKRRKHYNFYRLFQATLESILLYGSETWKITKSMSERIDGYYTRMLRMALTINWWDEKDNEVV